MMPPSPTLLALGGSCRRGVAKLTIVGTTFALGSALAIAPMMLSAGSETSSAGVSTQEIAISSLSVTDDGTIVDTDTGKVLVVEDEAVRSELVADIESGSVGIFHAGHDHEGDTSGTPSTGGDGHDHDHGLHCGIAAVPGTEGGVILQELQVNERQTLVVGQAPHEFLVDTTNYNAESELWNGPAVFTVKSGTLPAGVTLNQDGTWNGVVTQKGSHEFTVQVANDTTSFTVDYRLYIMDEADLVAPSWGSAATNVQQTIKQGTTPVPFQATGPGKLVYFTFDEVPGLVLFGDGTWNRQSQTPMVPGTYNLDIGLATTHGCGSVRQDFTLIVEEAAVFGFTSAPTNTQQSVSTKPGSQLVPVQIEGNRDKLIVTKTSGDLPPGVSLNGDGSFSGTPTKSGTYTFEMEATNDISQKATGRMTVIVTEYVAQDVAFTSAPTNTVQEVGVGSGLAPVVARATNGGALTYEVVSGALPRGVTLNRDGSFTGTISVDGVWNVGIRAVFDADRQAVTDLVISAATAAPPVADPGPSVAIPVLPKVKIPVQDDPTFTGSSFPPVGTPDAFTEADLQKSRQAAEDPNAPQLGDKLPGGTPAGAGIDAEGNATNGAAPGADDATAGTTGDGGPDSISDPNWNDLERISAEDSRAGVDANNPSVSEVSNDQSPLAMIILGLVGAGMLVLLGASGWFWKARRNLR